jgi:hypothetical protein
MIGVHLGMPADLRARWMRHMRRGEFEGAWQISDRVLLQQSRGLPADSRKNRETLWNGRPVDGKRVLIRCGHGLGDTIHFIRYAPILRKVGRTVIVQAQPELLPLLEKVEGIDTLTSITADPGGLYDLAIEVMELPYVFRTTLATVPAKVPYVQIKPRRIEPTDHLAVGVVWKAGEWDQRRDVPFELVTTLARVPGVTFHVLQRGSGLRDRLETFGIDSGSDDIVQAARTMAGLDLIISVDSMPAHLSGALAVPTWTLLHRDCDWRWMIDRTDCPWYPTMRLFRQRNPGDWEAVIKQVRDELTHVSRQFQRMLAA